MKMYSLYTPFHKVFKEDWFLPSIKDDFEVDIRMFDIDGEGVIGNDQFYHAMHFKVDTIIAGIRDNWGEITIYSDIDVQFFQPIEDLVNKLIEDKDMLIQRDSPFGVFCAGFMVFRSNEGTLRLFQDIKDLMVKRKTHDDQHLLNEMLYYKIIEEDYLLRMKISLTRKMNALLKYIFGKEDLSYKLFAAQKNSYGLRVAHLPDSFCSGGTFTAEVWEPGMKLPVPDDIVLHHGNWAKGVDHKVAQMEYVRDVVEARIESQ